jgi:hypothetical protein
MNAEKLLLYYEQLKFVIFKFGIVLGSDPEPDPK